MRLCTRCGRSNEDDAQYCQDCGAPLEETREETGPICPACGARNPSDSRFCQSCGVRLTTPQGPPSRAERLTCPVCGKKTPAGFAFCQYCGCRLPEISQETPVVQPTPPAGLPKPTTASWAVVSPPENATDVDQDPGETTPMTGLPATAAGATQSAPQGQPSWNLSVVVMDILMAERSVFPIEELPFDIGRTEGHITFPEDPYLSARHLRIQATRSGFEALDLGSLNGVYLRVERSALVSPGTFFIVGNHLLRLQPVHPWERELRPAVERGVRLWGTKAPRAWARLEVLSEAGTVLDVHHLTKTEIVIGTDGADIPLPDDPMVARSHAMLSHTGQHITLRDLESDFGTYVRLDRPWTVRRGTVLRAGLHLVELEITQEPKEKTKSDQ